MHTSVVEGAVGGFDSRGGLQSEPQRLLSLVPFEYNAERRRRRTGVLRTVSSRYFNARLVAVAISALWALVAASPPCATVPWHDCRLWPPQIHARSGTHTPPILPALLVMGEKFNPARKPSSSSSCYAVREGCSGAVASRIDQHGRTAQNCGSTSSHRSLDGAEERNGPVRESSHREESRGRYAPFIFRTVSCVRTRTSLRYLSPSATPNAQATGERNLP